MSNVTGDEGSYSSGEEVQQHQLQQHFHGSEPGSGSGSSSQQQQKPNQTARKKRNLPGTPDPCAEVIALSPTTLMATNRFVCEICSKGFARDQNLQLHRRGHNLPWKLKQRISGEAKKRVYICPEPTCLHHNPGRALGDLTGIKKHYSRKHGEKKWTCDKCSKKYAVQSDWKAHLRTCGTREYKCDCGTIFSRRDSFITHRAFCDALAEENSKANQGLINNQITSTNTSMVISEPNKYGTKSPLTKSLPQELIPIPFKPMNMSTGMFSTSSGALFGNQVQSLSSSSSGLQLSPNGLSSFNQVSGLAHMSATGLLQKAAQMGATASNSINSPMMQRGFVTTSMVGPDHGSYDNQSDLVGIKGGGFTTQLLQRDPQEAMGEMGMFSEILMGVDDGLIKNNISNSSLIMDRSSVGPGPSRFGGNGHDDTLTVDFLGVGGSRSSTLQQQGQKRKLNLEVMSQQRVQGMNPFQQHLSNSDSVIEKPMWDD